MSNNIDDIIVPILREIQADLAGVKSDVGSVKGDVAILRETVGKIDIRLGIVESHMTGFMSSARFLEVEINELRGRIEALEQRDRPSPAEYSHKKHYHIPTARLNPPCSTTPFPYHSFTQCGVVQACASLTMRVFPIALM